MSQPFTGVRVLDFTQVFAGPFGSYQLALLGADVIKIERPGGDDMRYGPPNKEWADRGLGTGWMAINANKRNIALDLTKPDAIAIVKKLAEKADVVMENFRPGVMDKLGIGYEALSKVNPRIIYAAVSGFGQTGPERTTGAYDGKIQAMSGLMSITGSKESGPTRAGFAVCDAIGGMSLAFGVASALYQRTHTGKGQLVDVAMLDSALTFMSSFVVDYTVGGHVQGPSGNRAQSRLPTADLFKVKDGHLLLAVNNDKQFIALAKAIGHPDLPNDPRFVDWPARIENEVALRQIIEEVFATADAATWDERLTAANVPCSRIWSIAEVVKHPQLAHRTILQKVDSPHGEVELIASGIRYAHGGAEIKRFPVMPGADTDAVLGEAGYSPAEIAAFKASGVATTGLRAGRKS
ncbi:MAG TPA: CoA transferase [Hyphomicrobiaceae bacterium]|nr:CoA transferase [Hyphomicrobiaceae bacterium]